MDALRFGVGDEVECQVGVAEWARGKVVALMYRDEQMPPGVVAPYQVRLDPQPGQQTAEADQDGPDAGGGGQDRAEAEAEGEAEAEAEGEAEGRLIWVPMDTDDVVRRPRSGWGCTMM